MALKVVGVQLVADDAANYIATLNKTEDAEERVGKGAQGAAKGLNILERAAKGAGERLGHMAVDALADAGRAVVRFGVDSINAAGDFESGMNSFAAVVGDSLGEGEQSLADFKDLFISLGRDLPVSTAEVQQAAIEMAKGGIEPATIAAGGLEQTLQFAAAGGLELADAATIAAKTIGGWADVNASAEQKAALLAHSTDLLARAANASTVDVDELALGLYNVQGTARSTGATLDETVTTLALLAPNFNSSAEAGNAMKNMLLRLQPATAPAAAAMGELGLLTKDGNSAFYDAQGNFIGMRATAAKLEKALGGLSEAQRTEALRTIFGNDALNAANTLLMQGADGYDRMTDSLSKQMGVAEQARLKQQGWNTAVDNLKGSLEAFQITVGSLVLPALTSLVGTLAAGVNAVTDYAAATAAGETALAHIADFISTVGLPAIYGLTAATIAYSATALAPLLVNLPAMTAVLIYNTTAVVANAAAVAAAAAPYVLIAAAVAGVAYAWNDFQDKLETATEELLNSKPFWQESTATLEALGNASQETQDKFQPLADSIREQRDLLEENIQFLGHRLAAGSITEAQYIAEMEAINAQASAIDFASKGLQGLIDEEARVAAASMTATAEATRLSNANAELGSTAQLTADDIEKLGAKIQKVYDDGATAIQGYASNQATFLAGIEDRQAAHAATIEKLEKEKNEATTEDQRLAIDDQIKQANQAYADQETAAATSYANQQAAQKRHLGQLLIDYTVGQASLGNITKEKASEIAGELERAYGLQESSTASTFLKMAGAIDTFAADAGGDVTDLTKTLADQQQQAAETQKSMDDYAKTYTAEAVSNFLEQKSNAAGYISELEKIPDRVDTRISTPGSDAAQEEIETIERGLDQLPTQVTIHIRVKDDVPDEYKPGSPTPFEMGIRGIEKALKSLGQSGIALPGISESLSGISDEMNKLLGRSDAPEESEDLGENIVMGLVDGIADNIADAIEEGRNLVQQLVEGMEDEAEVDSPSELTAETGANLGLGLVVGMQEMLPAILDMLQQTASMMIAGIDDLDEELQDEARDMADNLIDVMEGLSDEVSGAVADAFGSVADINRQAAENLRDLSRFAGNAQFREQIEAQIAAAEEAAAQIQDPAEAAEFFQLRSKQIFEMADLNQDQAKTEEQRLSDQASAQQDYAKTIADLDKESAELTARQAQARTQAEYDAISAAIRANNQARTDARSRYEEERAQIDALAFAEQQRLQQRINLLKKAQELELQALQEQQSQSDSGALAALAESIQTILDNLPPQSADAEPDPLRAALLQLLVKISTAAGLSAFAAGGRYPLHEPFLVGERGPEIIWQDRPGSVIPMQEMRSAMSPAFGGAASYQGGTINLGGITINGTGLSEASLRRAVYGAVNDVANAADLRIRMGVA